MQPSDLGSAMRFTRETVSADFDARGPSPVLEAHVSAREAATLSALLPDFMIERHSADNPASRPCGVVAFSAQREKRAAKRAEALGVPFVRLGHGLLRAPPGWNGTPFLSATARSTIGPNTLADVLDASRLLASPGWENPELLSRASAARHIIASQRLAGPWWNSGTGCGLPGSCGFILIEAGEDADSGSAPSLFRTMLAAASAERAPAKIVVLSAGHRHRNRVVARLLRDAALRGCTVLAPPFDVWEAIERSDCVYTAGGESGFLAVLAGARVRCFAECFYSGWGITADEPGVRRHSFRRSIDEILAGWLVSTRCLDPFRNIATSFEQTLELLAEWQKIEKSNRRIAVCLGMSFWKRRQVRDFLRSSAGVPAFRRTVRSALAAAAPRPEAAVAVWASRAPAGLTENATSRGVPLIRVEDGFIRSVGLGSDFMPPASLVLDGRGMHFDPGVRSDLETLLLETEFDAPLIERARRLVGQLIARGVTKYNLGTRMVSIRWPAGRKRILVPGQVEDDLSVRLGGAGITRNVEMLRGVRLANPDAFIAYKPHPDVEAGHRRGKVPDEVARSFADLVVRDVSTAAILPEIDELHTLTSLAGFEALLRRRRVVVYGRPFYAGWGLTTDLAAMARGRRLTLEELVAGALILYPRYLDPVTRLPCGPEIVIERFDNPELWKPGPLVLARRLQGALSRRWNELAGRYLGSPAEPLPPSRRDNFRTP